ncbi:MAG: hypothetical protein KF726_20405 [Anaerolineae bacterium]|nr:hypothetical protein [Anaerolineae bacterium]
MTTRKRRKPTPSRGGGSGSATKKTTVKASAKSFATLNRSLFETPTKATAQQSSGSGEKPIDPLVAWWIGLTPAERDQIGLKLLLKMRDFSHLLGNLYNDFQAAIPFTSKPPTGLIPPEEPKG